MIHVLPLWLRPYVGVGSGSPEICLCVVLVLEVVFVVSQE